MSLQGKKFTSSRNYFPGPDYLPAGSIFTLDDWIRGGARESDLEDRLKSGSIREAVQTPPPAPKVPEAPEAPEKTKPSGIWTFTREELEPFAIDQLNIMYKTRAEEFSLRVRPYKDKEALITKMTSEL